MKYIQRDKFYPNWRLRYVLQKFLKHFNLHLLTCVYIRKFIWYSGSRICEFKEKVWCLITRRFKSKLILLLLRIWKYYSYLSFGTSVMIDWFKLSRPVLWIIFWLTELEDRGLMLRYFPDVSPPSVCGIFRSGPSGTLQR